MMAMRRYLTSKYDWRVFSRRFYISHSFEIIAVVIVALLVGLALWRFHMPNPIWSTRGLTLSGPPRR
jgi:hypothetical protein